MKNYSKTLNIGSTPQNEKILGANQQKNNAGGYSFVITKEQRLERFLILGSEGGTYYVGERDLTKQNYSCILDCIRDDARRTVDTIVEISNDGRAPKNSPAVFALSVVAANTKGADKTYALSRMPEVCRTSTDFFGFLESYKTLGGNFSSAIKRAIKNWYKSKSLDSVAYQMVKYRQRDGWTHLDALRIGHVKPDSPAENSLYAFAKSMSKDNIELNSKLLPKVVNGYLMAKDATSAKDVVNLITDYNLPREAIPTNYLNDVMVWEALLQNMPATAMIRSLGKMASMGMFKPLSANTKLVMEKLGDSDWLKKSRIHPITILNALKIYSMGYGIRGDLSWNANTQITDALDNAFYATFDNVPTTGKNIMYAVDISGSMGWGTVAGYEALTARDVSAAMSLILASKEVNYIIKGFGHEFVNLKISPNMSLDSVLRKMSGLAFGGTDCSLPMVWAHKNKIDVDSFVVITDNETWAGRIHPSEALIKYRKDFNPNAKLAVLATAATPFSIADPNDAGMMDFVGFDSAVPNILGEFIKS